LQLLPDVIAAWAISTVFDPEIRMIKRDKRMRRILQGYQFGFPE
jgi:hypothetical protein